MDVVSDLLREAQECRHMILSLIRRYIRRRDIADELMQDLYETILRMKPDEVICHDRAYLLRIARNLSIDWLRHRDNVCIDYVGDFEIEDLAELDFRTPERYIEGEQELAEISRAIDQVSDCRRTAFLLKKIYGYTQKQISVTRHIKENTVEATIQQATQDLSKLLNRRLSYRRAS